MDGPSPSERCSLVTSDGLTLDALLAPAVGDQPTAVAVICHPHPLYGGSMYNNVVGRLFADLPDRGVTAIRFDFRGVGASDGSHDGGRGERADVVAAIDLVADRHPGLPVILAGYSFGADVALAVDDPRVGGWLAVSPPLRIVDPAKMAAASDPRPKTIVSGHDDDFRPAEQAEELTASWPAVTVLAAPGVDHFWMNRHDHLTAAVDELIGRLVSPA